MTVANTTLKISMGTSPDFLEQILTKDVSTLEALYDLIDNSIDAARNQILLNPSIERDKYGLPKSYEGFEVKLDISPERISIADNCLGMDKNTLANKAFIIASSSSHDYGIGQYGIGLKRSLLKMGNLYEFHIDNGKEAYSATFNNYNIGGTKGELEAIINSSSGIPYTTFSVFELKNEIIKDIQNERWIKNAIKGLEDRYSIYFSKGFRIILNYKQQNYPLDSKLPKLRLDSTFLPNNQVMTFDNVKVIIESGIHESYYFPNESKYSLRENRKLTNDFGIYFICNDRVIVKSSTDEKHGWKTKWHSEYNGFVCLVRFIAKSPSDLPWNTSKSAMREDASLFLDVIDHIQPIADTYRSEIKQRYIKKDKKTKVEPNANGSIEPNGNTNPNGSIEPNGNTNPNDSTEPNGNTNPNDSTEPNGNTNPNGSIEPNSNTNPNGSTEPNGNTNPNGSTEPNINTNPNGSTEPNGNTLPPRTIPEKPKKTKKKQPPRKPPRDREEFIIWDNTLTRVPEQYKSAYAILYEMGELSSKEIPIACVALLRLFLEETLKTTLKSMNLLEKTKTQLSLRAKRVAEELYNYNYIDEALKQLILFYAATTKDNDEPTLFSINSIQSQIHSARFHPSQSRVNNYWDELDPFLEACWNYIEDMDNNSAKK